MRALTFPLRAARALGLAALLVLPAQAQIIADGAAPAGQHPQVGSAANGVPLVNIQTPSAAGVSHNSYRQFDIDARGVILNNARSNAQTQLGGWVQGNPNLAGGAARIILNEVRSSAPSLLGGFLEVAGSRAQVIVANPAGISCAGCGFINASRATLTTGAPIVADGRLEGFRVERGAIRVEGAGLDGGGADYTELIARALEINAGVWARELKAVAGANHIDAAGAITPVTAAADPAPAFSIDVAALGGMYADKIHLVGSEAGVGVRNAGQIGASAGAGEIVVTAAGRLENRGRISGAGAIALDSDSGIANEGTLYSRGALALATRGDLENHGTLAAQGDVRLAATGAASRIDSAAGSLLGAGVGEDGRLGGSATLEAVAGGQIAAHGQNLASGDLRMTAGGIDLADSETGAGRIHLDAAGLLDARRARVTAAETLALDAGALESGGSALHSQGDLALTLRSDYRHEGELVAGNDARIDVRGRIENRKDLLAGGSLQLAAAALDNSEGGQISASGVDLDIAGPLANRGLIDGSQVRITADRLANYGSGRLYGDTLALATNSLINAAEAGAAPVIGARERLDVGARSIDNREGALLFSAGDLAIGGALDGAGRATGAAATLANASATIEALGHLEMAVDRLENRNAHFATSVVETGREHRTEYAGEGSSVRYPGDQIRLVPHEKFTRLYTPDGGIYNNWYLYDYDRIASETQVTSSDPARILAGADLTLSADILVNDKSHILAGNTLAVSAGSLANLAAEGLRTTRDSGTVAYYYRKKRDGDDKQGLVISPYTPAPSTSSFTLAAARLEGHSAPAGSGTLLPGLTPTGAPGVPTSVLLPASSLYLTRPEPGARYLVETDPRFASYRNWLSSDWLLGQLGLDPQSVQKRLGDGFYEQRLLAEQVSRLTGLSRLSGYSDDEAQYQALMAAGASYAREWDLVPGVALSAEQMARLTSDIVWLVERQVTLADGSTQAVLVPQLYARVGEGDVGGSGALLAGRNLRIDLAGELLNQGGLAARDTLVLAAENIRNLGDIAAREVNLAAREDLENTGGRIRAEDRMVLAAGRDLRVASTTRESQGAQGARTNLDRIASLYVSGPQGELVAAAGRDLELIAAHIANAGEGGGEGGRAPTQLLAGRNLDLATVTESESLALGNRKHQREETSSREIGSRIQSAGDLQLAAADDLHARAALIESAQGAVQLASGGNLALEEGRSTNELAEHHEYQKKGFLSSKKTTTDDAVLDAGSLATTVSGETVALSSGGNLALTGAEVVSQSQTRLDAAGDITLTAGTSQHVETHARKTQKSGLFGTGGAGFTIGSQSLAQRLEDTGRYSVPSFVGSIEGDVDITATGGFRQTGSELIAPAGNIRVTAASIQIEEARDQRTIRQETKAKQSGLTVSVSSPLISAVQTAQAMGQAAQATSGNARMQTLAAASTALTGYNTGSALQAGQGSTIDGKPNQLPIHNEQGELIGHRDATLADRLGGISINISLGSSRSQSTTVQTSDTAAASRLIAGGDIELLAAGRGEASDLAIRGSEIQAGRNLVLAAENAIRLEAADNHHTLESRNKSSSASLGVGFNTASGFAITASASRGQGQAEGEDHLLTPTKVSAGNTAQLASGGDTTLKGASLAAQSVTATIGGDLVIESLQDSRRYQSRQASQGGSLSISLAGGLPSGSIEAGQSRIDSDYRSVTEQSGLLAGDGGFDITVAGDTTLTGGAITSSQAAIDAERNHFETGGRLVLDDLANRAEYRGQAIDVNLGAGFDPAGRLTPQGTSAGLGEARGKAESTTLAAISGIAGNTQARTGDAGTGIEPIFDAERVQKDIDAQVRITQTFGQVAPRAAADFADEQAAELRKQGQPEEARKWEEGGIYRVALHAALGALAGGMEGALGAGTVATAAPLLNELQMQIASSLREAGAEESVARLAGQLISGAAATGLGTLAAGGHGAGAMTALNADANNRQLHPVEMQRVKDLARGDEEKEARLFAAACARVRCYAEYEEDGEIYNKLKLFAEWGASEELAPERALLLMQDGLFGYSTSGLFSDQNVDAWRQFDNTYQATNRLIGAGQFALGSTLLAFSPTACATGVACVGVAALATMAADATQAGIKQLISGKPEETYFQDALLGFGLSPQAAKYTELAAGLGAVAATTTGLRILSYCVTNPAACNIAGIEIGNILAGEALPLGMGVGTVNVLAKKLYDVADPSQIEQIAARLANYTPEELLAINGATYFKDGNRNSAEAVNALLELTRGANAPYMPGTIVRDVTMQAGQKLYVIENAGAAGPGGWAVQRTFTDLNEARAQLALLPEWKNAFSQEGQISDLVIRKYTVTQPLPTRQGVVGPQEEYFRNAAGQEVRTGQIYPGGGKQVELLIDVRRETKNIVTGNPIWQQYLRESAEYRFGDAGQTSHPVRRM